MKKINKFVKKSVSKLDLSVKERKELEAEYIDHITAIYKEHLEDGFSEKESLEYAIKIFKSDSTENRSVGIRKNYIQVAVISLFIIYLLVLFSVYFYVSRMEILKGYGIGIYNIIPFRIIYRMIQTMFNSDIGSIMRLQHRIILFLTLIPMGIFIPILTSKYKSFLSNFKIYFLIVVFLEVVKIPFHSWVSIDYVLLNLLSCIIGYAIMKFIQKFVVQKRTMKI